MRSFTKPGEAVRQVPSIGRPRTRQKDKVVELHALYKIRIRSVQFDVFNFLFLMPNDARPLASMNTGRMVFTYPPDNRNPLEGLLQYNVYVPMRVHEIRKAPCIPENESCRLEKNAKQGESGK